MEISESFINACKNSHTFLKLLKDAAYDQRELNLLDQLCKLEDELFPEFSEQRKDNTKQRIILTMVEVNCTDVLAYRIFEAAKLYLKKKGDFDLKDASKIIAESNKIFSK